MSVTAEYLSMLTGHEIKDIDGGFLVKRNGDSEVHVLRMIFNWRIARTQAGCSLSYDRAWCFYGTDMATMLRTVQAALDWDMADNTAPEGWDKNAKTGEYRDNAGRIA